MKVRSMSGLPGMNTVKKAEGNIIKVDDKLPACVQAGCLHILLAGNEFSMSSFSLDTA